MTEIAADIVTEMNDLIETFGDTIIIYSPSSEAFSSYYHDKTTTFDSGTSAKGVVIRTQKDLIKEPEGELKRGRRIRMYVKAGASIGVNYKITHNSIDYDVTSIETILVEDTTLYYLVELTRRAST